MMSRYRFWFVAATAAILVFGVPLLTINAVAQPAPEIRLIRTGQNFSALIVTDQSRLLLINSRDRGETRSTIGHLARPWEAETNTILAPADDRAAIGLWEAMRHPDVRQVIIIGLPGNDPIWSAIEQESRERAIVLTYVPDAATIHAGDIVVSMYTNTDDSAGMVRIQRGEIGITIAVGHSDSRGPRTHAAVLNTIPDEAPEANLLLVPVASAHHLEIDVVFIREREVVRLVLEPERLRVLGGDLNPGADNPN
jgi:hypothetical protein